MHRSERGHGYPCGRLKFEMFGEQKKGHSGRSIVNIERNWFRKVTKGQIIRGFCR